MAIKGSATIELTNADGTKQIIKHDNMITNAVADMFRSYMGDMPLIHKLNFYDYTYAGTIFGGLLLFDDRLNDDASDYAIPSTKITGYASNTAYSGKDLSRGSRNIAESGLQEDGSYKLVWDFGTSQGNGTIQSIALCPIAMGKIGASDAPVRSEYVSYRLGEEAYVSSRNSDAKGAFPDYYRLVNATVDGVQSQYLYPVAIVGEYIYAVDQRNVDYDYSFRDYNLVSNGGILKLYKFKFQFNSASISARTGRAKYVETIDVQIPTEIVNLAYTASGHKYGVVGIHFNKRDNKLIVFPYSLKTALAPNATLPYVEIDLLDNYKVTNYTMTNTTNQSLSIYGTWFYGYGSCCGLYISNDHILMVGGTGTDARMYVINRTDNAKVVKVKIGGEDFVPYNLNYKNYLHFSPKIINNNTAVVTFGAFDGGADPYDMYIIDLTTGVAKKCNTIVPNTTNDYGRVINIYHPIMTDGAIVYDSDAFVGCAPKLNPFILTTKNNLDEPVVKTASQTMKITYTLTESAGV